MLLRFADFTLDDERLELARAGVQLAIQPQSRDVLLYLVKNRHRVVSKRELVDAVWGGVMLSETALAQAMVRLRRTLDDDPEQPTMVGTVRGRGYRFLASVTEHEGDAPERSARAFIGRASAVASLSERLEQAMAGRGSIALVAGESGIGKTRLLEELAVRFRARGAVVALAYGFAAMPSMWPWREAARSVAEQAPDLAAHGEPETGVEPARLFQALARFFKDAARAAPLALLVDDLDAADRDSVVFLELLARAAGDARLLVVATYREARAAADEAFARTLGVLTGADPGARVALGPLATADVAELAHAILGRPADVALLTRLADKTAGNPLLLTQLLHAARADEPRAATTSALLDEGALREAISGHLEGVSEGCTHALVLASVFGRAFDVAPLAMIAGSTIPAMLETLDEAIRARVVTKARGAAHGYRFTHALVRDVLYKRLTSADRITRHRAVAEALLAFAPDPTGDELDAIAKHFVAAAATDVGPAVAWSIRAAEGAVARQDVEGAAEHLLAARAALRLSRDVPAPGVEPALRRLREHPLLAPVVDELSAALRPR